jgi:ribosome small subunit-dependent GTPase A
MPKGKITKAVSGFYYVREGDKIVRCRGRGVFRLKGITPLVGDEVEYLEVREKEGTITDVFPRKNALIRPPVANVDQAILVFSAKKPDFNSLLLDRFLVVIESKGIDPVLIITKIDLLPKDEAETLHRTVKVYRSLGYPVILTSAKRGIGMEKVAECLRGKISVVAGQSGVGKSTLLNTLKPGLQLETGEISKHLGRGRHTTRHVELLDIAGGLVADTPGFSALDLDEIEEDELSHYFPEMKNRIHGCKFRGCLHVTEPRCAVKEAVEKGEIFTDRYEHYIVFLKEIQQRKPRY